jgi:hypothetical protein
MASLEEMALAPQMDGVAAVVRAIVSELATADEGLRRKLALKAGADIRKRMADAKSEASRNIALLIAANTCGVPHGLLTGQ